MSAPTGTIYDLGYKRYVGTRRSTATRWRVIMRNQIATAWKKWWRYKLALFLAIVTTFIAGAIMYFMSSREMRMIGGANGIAIKIVDGALPASIEWYCRFPAFILSLTLGSMIIASDTQTGAFTFYYVRPVRARDYVLGKLAGYGFLVATLVMVPPLVLAGFRLGLCDNVDQVVSYLWILPKTLAVGALATLAYTAIPLAISSLMGKRTYAVALWAAYYVLFGTIAVGMAQASSPAVAALDLQTALRAVTFDLFDVHAMRGFGKELSRLSSTTAIIMLLAQVAAAIGLIWYQVSRDEKSGVGGTS